MKLKSNHGSPICHGAFHPLEMKALVALVLKPKDHAVLWLFTSSRRLYLLSSPLPSSALLSSNPTHPKKLTEQDKAMGEEERFSGVLGTGGMTSHQRRGPGGGNHNNSHHHHHNSNNGGHHGQHNHGSHGNHGGGRDSGPSGPRFGSNRGGGGRLSPQAGPGGSGGGNKSPGGPGVYVPPALRPPGSGGAGAVSPTPAQMMERDVSPAEAPGGTGVAAGAAAPRAGTPRAEAAATAAGAEARSEEAKEAAKAQLMDVLDGKLRCVVWYA